MTPRHFLSFVSNFKNENPYLREWLDYHIKVGVDHFYLFDQDGSDEAKNIIQPYVENGYVTVHDWTKFSPKFEGPTYFFQKNKNHLGNIYAARNYRHLNTWMLKIDIDEFLYSNDPSKRIKDILSQYDSNSIRRLRVPRIDFGSHGHINQPDGGILENYLSREKTSSNYKDMGSTKFLNENRRCFSQHRWSYHWYKFGKAIELDDNQPLRINHYYTKSREEYFNRQNISRGRKVSDADFQVIEERCNKVFDDGVLRFLPL